MLKDRSVHASVVLTAFALGAIADATIARQMLHITVEDIDRVMNERTREERDEARLTTQYERQVIRRQQQRVFIERDCSREIPLPARGQNFSVTEVRG